MNKTKDDFSSSIQLQWAVIRGLEIIGEAAKNLSDEFRNKYSFVSWRKLAGMRDKLIHGYFEVDLELTWKVVQHDIPELKRKITQIREELIEIQATNLKS